MAKELDKNFDLTRVVFSPAEFFELLKKGLQPGSCVVYDEIGVGNNSKDAMSLANKHLSFIAQTIRPAAICVFFTTISLGLIDSQTRNLMDYAINVQGHDKRSGLTEFKFLKVRQSNLSPKPTMEHLQFADAGGANVKYVSWNCPAPDTEIANGYNKIRSVYLQNLYGDADATIKSGRNTRFGVARGTTKPKPILSLIAKEICNSPSVYQPDGAKFSPILVMEKYGIGDNAARKVLSLVKANLKMKKRQINVFKNTDKILKESGEQVAS
jgi:hypothetical protein